MDDDFLKALCSESAGSRRDSQNKVREASFSSYLSNAEETFIRRLTHSATRSQGFAADGEIGVFAAEKYFSGEMDMDYYVDSPKSTAHTDPLFFGHTPREMCVSDPIQRRALTRSLGSEPSWNSRSVLLQNAAARNSNSETQRKKGKKAKSFLSKLRCKCKCYCAGGESIDVDENSTEIIRTRGYNSGSSFADEGFSFPTMDSNSIPRSRTLKQQDEEEIPREPIEVFGSPALQKRNKSSSSKLKKHEQSNSDASSELFEIESATGNAKAKAFLGRQDSNGASSSRYVPSEASVEWSVMTASAADFSDYYFEDAEPPTSVSIGSPVYKNILMTKASKEARHLSPVLSGCSSLKSVGISGATHRVMNPRLDFDLLTRDYSSGYKESLELESEKREFESRNGVSASPRLFLRPSSPRAPRFMFELSKRCL